MRARIHDTFRNVCKHSLAENFANINVVLSKEYKHLMTVCGQGHWDPMPLGGVQNEEFTDKMGVEYFIGFGPRATKGFAH